MSDFRQALAQNPAPTRVGDVALRYEPSMLVGEAALTPSAWPVALAWTGGGLLVLGLGVLLAGPLWAVSGLLGLAAALLVASVWRRQRERRRRGFVVNFATTQLRLEVPTPLAGHPRTQLVPFDDVRAVGLVEQADGLGCLTVDYTGAGGALVKEALVTAIAANERGAAERLARVLEGAFGLGSIPPGSPYDPTLSPAGPAGSAATPAVHDGFDDPA